MSRSLRLSLAERRLPAARCSKSACVTSGEVNVDLFFLSPSLLSFKASIHSSLFWVCSGSFLKLLWVCCVIDSLSTRRLPRTTILPYFVHRTTGRGKLSERVFSRGGYLPWARRQKQVLRPPSVTGTELQVAFTRARRLETTGDPHKT